MCFIKIDPVINDRLNTLIISLTYGVKSNNMAQGLWFCNRFRVQILKDNIGMYAKGNVCFMLRLRARYTICNQVTSTWLLLVLYDYLWIGGALGKLCSIKAFLEIQWLTVNCYKLEYNIWSGLTTKN